MYIIYIYISFDILLSKYMKEIIYINYFLLNKIELISRA